jgi:hypothetical protein
MSAGSVRSRMPKNLSTFSRYSWVAFGVTRIEEPPVFGIGAEGLGIFGEFFLIVVVRVHGDAGDMKVRVIAELSRGFF